ncbi:MAG TPA: AEC family transporter [Azospirillaceae bacterium]|nr:AEC family transporter [Azospirillaceae bacterium]
MSAVVDVALPVFGIILAGFAAGRAGLLGRESSDALNRYVYWVALPPVLFLGLARNPLDQVLNGPFAAAFLLSLGAVAVTGALLGRLRGERGEALVLSGLNASFSNTGYLGIPLFLAAFGPLGLGPAILATVLVSSLVIGIAVVLIEAVRSAGHGLGKAAGRVLGSLARNPLILAPLAGALWSLSGLPVPRPLATFGDLLGASAGPCALFAIGLFLAGQKLRADLTADLGPVLGAVALKLLVQPLLAWALVTWVFEMHPYWAASCVLLAALPTGALTFVVAQQYRVAVERTSTVILVSTILAVPTLSALLAHYVPLTPP